MRYRCSHCGAVTVIDQQEADESRVLAGHIPAFIWCMKCPDKTAAHERIRVWGDDIPELGRDPLNYNEIGLVGPPVLNRQARRKLRRKRT